MRKVKLKPWKSSNQSSNDPLQAIKTPQGLALFNPADNSQFLLDFCRGPFAARLKSVTQRHPLARAIGIQAQFKPRVIDATAGWARDAVTLANLGCKMILIERSAEVSAVVTDALQRLFVQQSLAIELITGEAKETLLHLSAEAYPDVIYLDPMYPHRTKSALVKKEMRFLRQLVGEDKDAGELLRVALMRATQRVVVKRPKGAAALTEQVPDFIIKSPNTRYDVYVVAKELNS